MKRIVIALFLIGIAVIASAEISTAKITDAFMFDAETGKMILEEKPVFSNDASEFLIKAVLKYAPENTEVKASWYYLEENEDPYLIDEAGVVTGSGSTTWTLDFNITKPYNGWPRGEYKVVLQVQTKNAEPVEIFFSVQK